MDLTPLLERLSLPIQVEEVLKQSFLGNTVLQYCVLLVAFLLAWPLAALVWRILSRLVPERLTARISDATRVRLKSEMRFPAVLAIVGAILYPVTAVLTHDPEAASASANYPFLIARGFFAVVGVLACTWLIHRVLEVVREVVVEPFLLDLESFPESRFVPMLLKAVTGSVWLAGLSLAITASGPDAMGVVQAVLSIRVLGNALYQYLVFVLFTSIFLLIARFLLQQLERTALELLEKRGYDPEPLHQDWLADLYRPISLIFVVIGIRICSLALRDYADGAFTVYTVLATALDVTFVGLMVWISFIVTDKAFDFIFLPLARKDTFIVEEQIVHPMRSVSKVLLLLIGLVMLIQALGRDPATVLAGMGIGGLAIGLAAKDTLAPLISGTVIYISKPFKMGDFVSISDHIEGTVKAIDLRATTLTTPMGTHIIVPNDKVITHAIHNKTQGSRSYDGLFMRIDIATTPDKRDQTIELFCQAIREVEHAHDPTVYFLEYGADNLGLKMTYWVDAPLLMWQVRTQIMLLIDSRLRTIGVEMSLPTAALNFHGYLPDGDIPTVQIQPLPMADGKPVVTEA